MTFVLLNLIPGATFIEPKSGSGLYARGKTLTNQATTFKFAPTSAKNINFYVDK